MVKFRQRIVNNAHSKLNKEIFEKDDLLKERRERIKRKKKIYKNLALGKRITKKDRKPRHPNGRNGINNKR